MFLMALLNSLSDFLRLLTTLNIVLRITSTTYGRLLKTFK